MDFKQILVTGGAGFVGSNLATLLKRSFPATSVTAFDNLKRRGSELALARLSAHDVRFVHGDVRSPDDLAATGEFDLVIECAAEPSVHAGLADSPRYVLDANLAGAMNCFELARQRGAAVLLLSTSRVYPIQALNGLPYREESTRFTWQLDGPCEGCSQQGISERFTLAGARSFYGASKLAAELLLAEYAAQYGLRALVNRCGLIAGPWQMGKVDQGVVALWVARHYFQRDLGYIGYGGQGKQVRDVLAIDDLFQLIVRQLAQPGLWDGRVYNVGGGAERAISLCELTELCRQVTGHEIPIGRLAQTSPVDIRIFVTDATRAQRDFDWRPAKSVAVIVEEIHAWLRAERALLEGVFA